MSMSLSSPFNDPMVSKYMNQEGMGDVYVHNMGVVVQNREKRFIRIRWGDTAEIPTGRWVGFAPADWKRNRPLATDPQLLGFYVKPNLCDRSTKSKKQSGWVTLSIDGHRRAIKATIDGWTLGKVGLPRWLLGRIMRPVAIAEVGTPIQFDIDREEGCEKVLRSGFQKWSTTCNSQPAILLRCAKLNYNYEHIEQRSILGITLKVKFSDEDQSLQSILDLDDGYISYDAVERYLANPEDEIIPLVINDRHAFRIKQKGLWDLFYADGRTPLDYLSERISALVRKIHVAKQRHDHKQYVAALTRLTHLRHILYFLSKDQNVVKNANNRVSWFLQNTSTSGTHKKFTPDLGQLLVCLAVSDYEWEDIAIPFFAESLSRSIPQAVKDHLWLRWGGPECSDVDELFEALMTSDNALSYNMLQVTILNYILKPHYNTLDDVAIERLSAEELCCGIAGLSEEFRILEYERSSRKDEVKKLLIKGEWENEFTAEQWSIIDPVLTNPVRLRGMLHRARMIAECHGTCGLPTPEMFDVINGCHESSKTVAGFKEFLGYYFIEYPGDAVMFSVLKKSILMAQAKGYMCHLVDMRNDEEGMQSPRVALRLKSNGDRGLELFRRQKRAVPKYEPEVLPKQKGTSDGPSATSTGGLEEMSYAPEAYSPAPDDMDNSATRNFPLPVHVPIVPPVAVAPLSTSNVPMVTPTSNAYTYWHSHPNTPMSTGMEPITMSPQVSFGSTVQGSPGTPGSHLVQIPMHTLGSGYAQYYTYPSVSSAPVTPNHQYVAPYSYGEQPPQMVCY